MFIILINVIFAGNLGQGAAKELLEQGQSIQRLFGEALCVEIQIMYSLFKMY